VNGIPDDRLKRTLKALQLTEISHVDCFEGKRMVPDEYGPMQNVWRLSFSIRNAYLASPIKRLRRIGVGEEFGEIEVMQIVCSTEELPRCQRKRPSMSCWRWPSIASRRSTLEIHSSITQRSHFNYDHFLFILVASSIGAIGLLTDSLAFVMASFFISPLMQMVLAVAWGVAIYDWSLVRRGLRNVLFGVSLSLLAGGSTALCLAACDTDGLCQAGFLAGANDTMSSRSIVATINIDSLTILAQNQFWPTSPFVAALSGIAVALGESGGIPSALSGVALSSTLLLPVVNAGMMLVLASLYPHSRNSRSQPLMEVALHSLLHYLIDVCFILTFAIFAFKMKHVSGKSLRPIARRDRLSSHSASRESINSAPTDVYTLKAHLSHVSPEGPLLQKALSFSKPRKLWAFEAVGRAGPTAKGNQPETALIEVLLGEEHAQQNVLFPTDVGSDVPPAEDADSVEDGDDVEEITLLSPRPFSFSSPRLSRLSLRESHARGASYGSSPHRKSTASCIA
jgi:uncharacterized membrane protein